MHENRVPREEYPSEKMNPCDYNLLSYRSRPSFEKEPDGLGKKKDA
jgi:hypothetical protein